MGIHALPFWNMVVTYRIPLSTIELDETSSIGLHIRKKRLERKLRQEDVAQILDITTDCVTYWENGRSKPQIQFAPKIIKFLGYNPYVMEPETLGGQVKNYRLLHGLSHRKMGGIVGVDGATISTWETGKFMPDGTNLKRLEEILSE